MAVHKGLNANSALKMDEQVFKLLTYNQSLNQREKNNDAASYHGYVYCMYHPAVKMLIVVIDLITSTFNVNINLNNINNIIL